MCCTVDDTKSTFGNLLEHCEFTELYLLQQQLTFVSKLVVRVAVKQLVDYIETNELIPQLQSAYRRHHSIETALLKVMSDVLAAADSQNVTLLALLDLSSAFDCVDQDTLLSRLQSTCGEGGTVLAWIRSFLSERF